MRGRRKPLASSAPNPSKPCRPATVEGERLPHAIDGNAKRATTMTDNDFERIKAEEKKRLRTKRRLQDTLEALKKQNKVQSTVRRMQTAANRLLRENEGLVEGLRTWTARQAARLEAVLDPGADGTADEWAEVEKDHRTARAAELVRQYKRATAGGHPPRSESTAPREEDNPGKEESPPGDAGDSMPEKTIGRMHKRADTPDT